MKYFTLRLFNGRMLLETLSANKPLKRFSIKVVKDVMKQYGANYCEVYQSEHLGYTEGLPVKQISIK
jgi:hypothetical protein